MLSIILYSETANCLNFLGFFNSNFFQSLITLGAIAGTAFFGLRSFHAQQKTKRLQKIYFDDSLLLSTKKIDDGITAAEINGKTFGEALDIMSNLMNKTYVIKDALIHSLKKKMDSMISPDFFVGDSIKSIIYELVPDERGDHIGQWLNKYNEDTGVFYAKIYGQFQVLINSLLIPQDRRSVKEDEKMIKKMIKDISDQTILLTRHKLMFEWFFRLIRRYANIDFKNRDELVNAYKNENLETILKKIDTAFKIMFTFSKESDNIYYSFAKDEEGRRFKLSFGNGDVISVKRVQKEYMDNEKFLIIRNELPLINATIYDTKNSFINALIGMANYELMDRHPNLFKEILSFT